jgi:hypothetical protein
MNIKLALLARTPSSALDASVPLPFWKGYSQEENQVPLGYQPNSVVNKSSCPVLIISDLSAL